MYSLNQKVKSIGVNMNCDKVVITSTFVRYLPADEIKIYTGGRNGTTILDCIVFDSDMSVMMDSRKLFV